IWMARSFSDVYFSCKKRNRLETSEISMLVVVIDGAAYRTLIYRSSAKLPSRRLNTRRANQNIPIEKRITSRICHRYHHGPAWSGRMLTTTPVDLTPLA